MQPNQFQPQQPQVIQPTVITPTEPAVTPVVPVSEIAQPEPVVLPMESTAVTAAAPEAEAIPVNVVPAATAVAEPVQPAPIAAAPIAPEAVTYEQLQPAVDTAQLFAADQVASGAYAQPLPANGRSKRMMATVAVAVLVVVGVLGIFGSAGVSTLSHSNATKQSKAFIAALNAGDNAKAYSMTTANLRQQQSESAFNAALGNLKSSNPELEATGIAFNGRAAQFTTAEINLPPTDSGDTTGVFDITLVRSGLVGWKIDSVSVQ